MLGVDNARLCASRASREEKAMHLIPSLER
jgi:hypothetical protein